MIRTRMDLAGAAALAVLVSCLLTLLLIVFGSRFQAIPQGRSALIGLSLFIFIITYDLCILYYAWSRRSEKEAGVASSWRAGLAVGSLLLALTAGVLLRSLSPSLWEAFLSSSLIVNSAHISVSHWLGRKSPESKASQSRDLYITSGFVILLMSVSLSLEMLPESSRAVLGAMVLALGTAAPQMIYGRFLQQGAH